MNERSETNMPLHLYIDNYFQEHFNARHEGVVIENLPIEKRPKVEKIENRTIQLDSTQIPIRIYTPDPLSHEENHYPLLIFFHGGSLIPGALETHDVSCRLLSSLSGYKVIAVDYSSDSFSKSTFESCYFATKWIVEQAKQLHGIAADVAISGASIGATIATSICIHANKTNDFQLTKQVLYYPLIDLNNEIDKSPFQSRILYNGKYGVDITTCDTKVLQECFPSPLNIDQQLLNKLPKTLIFTAEFDPLCDEGEQYATNLKKANVYIKHVHFDGNIHGFMQYFPGSPDYMRGYQLTREFLNEE